MPNNSNGKPKLSLGEAFKSDFPASIIVFLVALPLCIGIAIASGAPPATGLISGIVGGLIVGWIAGSPLQVSGPAAGLFVLVAKVIEDFGETESGGFDITQAMQALGMAVFLAGLIQLAAGLLKFGSLFRAVSPAVIQGMLSGIGVLIFAKMFHQMVDDETAAKEWVDPLGKGLANLVTIPKSIMTGLTPIDGEPHHLAAMIGVGTIVILVFWRFIPIKALRVLPPPVVAVVAASIVAYSVGITKLDPHKGDPSANAAAVERTVAPARPGGLEVQVAPPAESELLRQPGDPVHIEQVEVPSDLTDGIYLPTRESWLLLLDPALLVIAVTIALVASAETMLCCAAVDKMQQHVKTKYNKELTAQGLGNTVCGLLGVLPITGVIVRSSANVDAGARTRMSAILHGAWLLILVAVFPGVLNLIPMASLAAVLVVVGWKLINFPAQKKLWKTSKSEGLICLITLSLVVAVDLLTGVLVGIALAAAKLLWAFSHVNVDVDRSNGKTTLHVAGPATFLALPKLTAILDEVDPSSDLHVDLDQVTFVDHAVLELFTDWEKQHEAAGGKLHIDWEDLTATFHQTKPRSPVLRQP
ncbi:membrane protein containing sulfate transporter domain protein [Rhodopirellula maiorica SM1]|uniref:Membrane protein containing sulfate transporter domain protein n=1 Tax=Rhodopirellula maiorica SM1 TaxID=1265738 RepID=M5RM95_9BACT|nr:SulP family inorganic anion transporter [Rhodopirellula maiorica]EMI20425.1 membrane protein containing sulfate transporter domain protein [Rhodopirellula maiorica SM1]